MTIVRRLARPLLAAPLIAGGLTAFRHPGPAAEAARPVLGRVTDQVGDRLGLPEDPELLVRAGGGLTAAAGALLAIGRLPRLSALAIVLASPAVQAVPPFWREKDPQLRAAQQALFLKNLGLVGGALLAAVDTQGRPGVGYRTRRAARRTASETSRAAGLARHETRRTVREARREAKLLRAAARAGAHRIADRVTLPTG